MCADDKKMDATEIIERMMLKAGFKQRKELAENLGLSSQALTQIKARQSISLPLLIMYADKHNVSLDYLVYGRGEGEGTGSEEKEKFVALPIIEAASTGSEALLYSRAWLDEEYAGREHLTQIIVGTSIYIIDLADKTPADGLFIIGQDVDNINTIATLKKRLDGKYSIANEPDPMTVEQLTAIGIVGRVIWAGKSHLPDRFKDFY